MLRGTQLDVFTQHGLEVQVTEPHEQAKGLFDCDRMGDSQARPPLLLQSTVLRNVLLVELEDTDRSSHARLAVDEDGRICRKAVPRCPFSCPDVRSVEREPHPSARRNAHAIRSYAGQMLLAKNSLLGRRRRHERA